jgi:two-component system chemotaxis response regulator CheY
MRSLVVEDEFVARSILQRFLSRYGASDVAVDGAEAVEAARAALDTSTPYDVICLDVQLPKLDGHEVLTQVRALEQTHGIQLGEGSRIIMTTSLTSKDRVMGAFRGGADAYLVKPIELQALSKALQELRLLE